MSQLAQLCAVVLSYRNEGTVLEAVRSLLDQDEPVAGVAATSAKVAGTLRGSFS